MDECTFEGDPMVIDYPLLFHTDLPLFFTFQEVPRV
jgi:hypothetical protein